MTIEWTELVGYLASALIVLSLLMSSVYRLRVINLVGALVFTAYGVLIGSIPVVLTNGAIVIIDLYYLAQMARARAQGAYFEVVAVPADSPLLERFLAFHREDARRFQPEFDHVRADHLAWMVLRDAVPVGIVLARTHGEVATIDLDYVVPEHRDQRAGTRFHSTPGLFATQGVRTVRAIASVAGHRRYLRDMGFTRTHDDVFERAAV